MPLVMKCSICNREVVGEEEYYYILLVIHDENHREDDIDQEHDDFCKDCINSKANIAKLLLDRIDKRNPDKEKK